MVPIYNILIRLKKEEDITGGCEEHELVKSEALSSSFNDSGSCGLGESKSSDSDLGNLKESDIISHGADNDSDSISTAIKCEITPSSFSNYRLPLLAEVLNEAGKGQRRSVDLGSDESSHDGLSEN